MGKLRKVKDAAASKEDKPLQMIEEEVKVDKKPKKVAPKKKKEFRMQAKTFFLTYPKCTMDKKVAMDQLKGKRDGLSYGLCAREMHEDGEPHIHAVLQYDKKVDIVNEKYYDLVGETETFHGNYQVAKDVVASATYCKKDGDWVEEGMLLDMSQAALQKRALANKVRLTTPLPQLIDEGVVSIVQYKQLKESIQLYNLDKVITKDSCPRICIWIYGTTGIGKSYWVRKNFPGQFYNKMMNKWWDSYTGQRCVLLDDFDLKGECLGHHLKIWGDDYSFQAEIKCLTAKPDYDYFIITSQYLPGDIFCQGKDSAKWDNELKEAIERRFTICTISNGELISRATGEVFDHVKEFEAKKAKWIID